METIEITLEGIFDLAKETLSFNGCNEINTMTLSDTILSLIHI